MKALDRTQWRYCGKIGLAAALGYLLTQGAGTLVGMLAGMAVSLAFGPSAIAVGLAVALTALLSIGLGWGVPAARIGVTLCIITLVMHRADALEYNALRALNTVIGVAVGLAVSFVVWPVRARDALHSGSGAALDAAARLLDALDAGGQDLRPLQLGLYDALAALVKAAREGDLEKRVFAAHEPDPHARQVLHFGLEVLAAALAGGGPRPAADSLRRRLAELRAA